MNPPIANDPTHGSSHCASCGLPLLPGTLGGQCPRCLLGSTIGPGAESLLPSGHVFGDFEILGKLGSGGMGIVYHARQISLNRPVALKMVRAVAAESERDIARFRQEAEAAARLDHPNIVPVYDAGEHGGCHYFTMKLVEGARSLAGAGAGNQPGLTSREAARLVVQMARAVHYAHRHGVIHRDIKPGNILLDAVGEPHLADFGLAKLLEARATLTEAEKIIGTPQYMSPEQATGDDITTSTDIYSLGAVFYELLTGHPPFESKSIPNLLRLLIDTDPRPVRSWRREIDADLETICMKCLEKSPARRYGSAEALANDIDRWLNMLPIHARPSTLVTHVAKWVRRRPGMATLAAGLIATGLAGLIGVIVNWRAAVQARRDAESAQRVADDHLWESLRAQAVALRWSGVPERRYKALDALESAIRLRPARKHEVRNETMACLALVGVRPAEQWPGNPGRRDLVALDHNFTHYAHSYEDGRISIRSRSDNSEQATLQGGGPVSWILTFSPDDRWLAVGESVPGARGVRLKVWDWRASRVLFSSDGVIHAAFHFSADGRLAALARADGSIDIVKTDDWTTSAQFKASRVPHTIRFSPDASRLAVSSIDDGGMAEILDCRSGSQLGSIPGLLTRRLAWSPNGDMLALPVGDGRIVLWHVADEDRRTTLDGHTHTVEEVAWSPAGDLLASQAWDGSIRFWDPNTTDLLATVDARGGPLAFSPDGTRFGPIRHGAEVGLLEISPSRVCQKATGHVGSEILSNACWSRDGTILATTGDDGVRLWNRTGRFLARLTREKSRGVVFANHAFYAAGVYGVQRWPLHAIHPAEPFIGPMTPIIPLDSCEDCALTPDGLTLAVARNDGVRLIDLRNGAPARFLEFPRAAFVDISHDGHWLAAGTWQGLGVRVWSLPSGDVAANLPVPGSAEVAFSPDMNDDRMEWLITGDPENYRFWTPGTWNVARAPVPHGAEDRAGNIAFSPRKFVVAFSSNGRLSVHQIEDMDVWAVPDFDREVPLCFDPYGSVLVAGRAATGKRHFLLLWDIAEIRKGLKAMDNDWDHLDPIPNLAVPVVQAVRLVPNPPESP